MSVRMICADAIGEIAGTLMKLDKKSWPKFTECIFVFLKYKQEDSLKKKWLKNGMGVKVSS